MCNHKMSISHARSNRTPAPVTKIPRIVIPRINRIMPIIRDMSLAFELTLFNRLKMDEYVMKRKTSTITAITKIASFPNTKEPKASRELNAPLTGVKKLIISNKRAIRSKSSASPEKSLATMTLSFLDILGHYYFLYLNSCGIGKRPLLCDTPLLVFNILYGRLDSMQFIDISDKGQSSILC